MTIKEGGESERAASGPVVIGLDAAQAYCERILSDANTAPENAASVAHALVTAEADGLSGHGLTRLPSYAAQSRSGKVDGHARPSQQDRAPVIIAIDAAHGFAYPALDLAVEVLPPRVRVFGMAAAIVHRSHHCGVAGHVVERLAEAGLVAMLYANAPAAIAPWGGTKPVFGTNPIAFAAPLKDRAPIVVDLSVSRVARGNILKAAQEGKSIPEGWALDVDGKPTTDANRALEGTMIALGGAKGTALALMVEAFSAGITGSNFSFEASSFFTGDGPPPGTGQFILALDPRVFAGDDYSARMATLVAHIEGNGDARLPGDRRRLNRLRAERDGIIVPNPVLTQFGPP